MPGAVPQISRRMGLGRGLKTCNVPQNHASPNVGLQQQNGSSAGNADREISRSYDLEPDFGRVVPSESLEKLDAPQCVTKNRHATETALNPGAHMYSLSARPQIGDEGKLVALLVDRTQKSSSSTVVDCAVNGNGHTDHFGTPLHSSSPFSNAKHIERGMLEKSELGRPSPQHPAERFPNKEARERWIEACARFLKPALLQAQADRKKRLVVRDPQRIDTSNGSQTPPREVKIVKEENLTTATVSSEMGVLQKMNGPNGYHPEQFESRTMKAHIPQSMKQTDGAARRPQAVLIPTQSIAGDPIRVSDPIATLPAKPPARNPVFIKPLPEILTTRTPKIADGFLGKGSGTSPDSSNTKMLVRTGVQRGRTLHGSPEQECIKKERSHAVGDWNSFLVKNFSLDDDGSFAIWVTESEPSRDLEERLAKIDERNLTMPVSPRLGGAVLLRLNGKFLRVITLELRHGEATVEDVDSGDRLEVKLADLFALPQALKCIPPRALKVIVEADRITNAKRFKAALELAKQHQTVTDGCAVTWDFVPKFVFRLPGCRALAVSRAPISSQWPQDGVFSSPSRQKLYRELPEVLLPASGSVVKDCLITHVEGSTVYITYDELHNFILVPVAEDLPLVYEAGHMCLISPEWDPYSPSSQMRCCIEEVRDEMVLVRWIDCGKLFEVPKPYLLPLPADLIYPPGTVKATLASFQSRNLGSVGDALSRVLLSFVSSQIIFLDSKSVPEIMIYTDDFVEVRPETLNRLEALVKKAEVDVVTDELGEPEAVQEPPQEEVNAVSEKFETQEPQTFQEPPQEATVVGIAAFRQVWVVPRELMSGLEDMETRLTRSKPPLLEDCPPDTPCAVMQDGILRRGLIRLRVGKRFLVRLVDRATELSATRVFTLPEEYRDLESPCYRISLGREQIKDAHFGRFISALKMHPEVTLFPASPQIDTGSGADAASYTGSVTLEGHDTPTFFLTTPDGEDIMSAYGIREQPQ